MSDFMSRNILSFVACGTTGRGIFYEGDVRARG
jgi:hypothetical protein